ncbi:MAG: succinate dehydrogenase, cytochrome b556 subunit [Gammaproteobacteria bacterium]|nr:succinate dehydrogenase, cytochrome b556 subunit [Gammaproteobacteria bacterium]
MTKYRPINLALWTIRFPITAIISILHRISGFVLFLLIPCILWLWQYSLISIDNFNRVKDSFMSWPVKFILWVSLLALVYHLIAGVRHLIMDMHIGDSKQGGKLGSYCVLAMTVMFGVVFGVYLW